MSRSLRKMPIFSHTGDRIRPGEAAVRQALLDFMAGAEGRALPL